MPAPATLPQTGPLLSSGMPHCPPPAHAAPMPGTAEVAAGEVASREVALQVSGGSPAVASGVPDLNAVGADHMIDTLPDPVRRLADSLGGGPVQLARGPLSAGEPPARAAPALGDASSSRASPSVMLGTSPIGPPAGLIASGLSSAPLAHLRGPPPHPPLSAPAPGLLSAASLAPGGALPPSCLAPGGPFSSSGPLLGPSLLGYAGYHSPCSFPPGGLALGVLPGAQSSPPTSLLLGLGGFSGVGDGAAAGTLPGNAAPQSTAPGMPPPLPPLLAAAGVAQGPAP